MDISADEFKIPFFIENGFLRKKCSSCGSFFWTQDSDRDKCGDAPCGEYTFIKNSPARESLTLRETRATFLKFFEKKGHTIVNPYPIIARWRTDLYVTIASIIDFQPYVTDGYIPPPANPLVVSQPCLRFEDIDNVGPTAGRHMTIFEMGGAHAFNFPDKKIYWKNETIALHHELLTEEFRVPSHKVTYKEHFWSGGGNAGPDVEAIVDGLEISTLVFMMYKVANGKLSKTSIDTVDTGYGMERWCWLSQGSIDGFHAVFGPLLTDLLRMSGIGKIDEKVLIENVSLSGMANIEKLSDKWVFRRTVAQRLGMDPVELDKLLTPLESIYAVADHTKALVLMLAEGIVPSNAKAGYLARLLLRRTYRLLRELSMEKKLLEIANLQIGYWAKDFPQVKLMKDEIIKALDVEQEKYQATLKRGAELVKKASKELKERKGSRMPLNQLVEFYESHGMTPNIVKEISDKMGVAVSIPDDFYTMIAKEHLAASDSETSADRALEERVQDLPPTRPLYYEDVSSREFRAKVLRIVDGKYIILDQSAFYPEGGGQPSDQGKIVSRQGEAKVLAAQKVGRVILHEAEGQLPREGNTVSCLIDWPRRLILMRHHTSTHLVMGAARRVLGEHVWQAGAQKGLEKSRLDITHFEKITPEELRRIELLANEAAFENIPVEVTWLPRADAEKKYGFRLYQGGVVPGREIRVVKVGDWDVEACGGTHCRSTGEVGFIKILGSDRIQDGVERLTFAAGIAALKFIQERDESIRRAADALNTSTENFEEEVKKLHDEHRESRKELARTGEELANCKANALLANARDIGGIKVVTESFRDLNLQQLISIGNSLVTKEPLLVIGLGTAVAGTAGLVVMSGNTAVHRGVNSGKIAEEASKYLGGSGGGKPRLGQGGGPKIEALREALDSVIKAIEGKGI